jgi:hypothetical protein
MPKQPNPDNADSPQEIGDRISAAGKPDPNAPPPLRQRTAQEAGKPKKRGARKPVRLR